MSEVRAPHPSGVLAERMDIARVPHLKGRNFLEAPRFDGDGALCGCNLLGA